MKCVRAVGVGVVLAAVGCNLDGFSAPEIASPDSARGAAERREMARAERLAREAAIRAADEAERRAALAEAERLAAERRAQQAAELAEFEATYPLHGVVFHYLAQVFAEPGRGTPIGYLRRGSQFRATEGEAGPDCESTWHRLPGGGQACRGAGYILGGSPQTFDPSPVAPTLEDALPYAYGYTSSDDRPQYWRIPTLEEEEATAAAIARVRELEEAAEGLVEDGDDVTDAAGSLEAADAGPTPSTDDESTLTAEAVEAPDPPGEHPLIDEAEDREDTGDDADDGSESLLPSYVRMRMRRGFYVSLDRREETEDGREFYRTVRGGYIRATDLVPNEPPTNRGVVFGGEWELPLAIVFRQGAHHYRRRPDTGELVDEGTIERHRLLRIAQGDLEINGRRYVATPDGILVRDTIVRPLQPREVPPGVDADAKWIHIDLSEQTLIAYEGGTPVFGTVVSSGKPGFETPTGLFRIQSKHVSTTMDNLAADDSAYSIEDVPWTMYFEGNYALHGAFWHSTFGRVRSHGCVNLAPADARWLFPVDNAHATSIVARHLRPKRRRHVRLHRVGVAGTDLGVAGAALEQLI